MIVAADVPVHTARFSEMYGHAAILRSYVGAEDDRLKIAGQVQHGWSVGAGVEQAPTPMYLWNERSMSAARSGGVAESETIAIGAPYLYLPAGADTVEIGRVPLSLLAIPQHSTGGYPLADGYDAWQAYAWWLESVRKDADLEQVTVCLHENERDDPAVCHILARSGLVIACAGSPRMARSTYLDRFRAFVRQHGMVTSNAIGTAILYAAYEGAPVFIDGPVFRRASRSAGTTETCYPQVSDPDWIDHHFPTWRCSWKDTRQHRQDAERELGLAYMRSRAELWNALKLAVMP